MFEKPRETMYNDENNAQGLKNEIISILKMHKFSLSQIRTLFHEIVNDIEDTPIK